jgi:hypothetical protein
VVDHRFTLDDASDAIAFLKARKQVGKVILQVEP